MFEGDEQSTIVCGLMPSFNAAMSVNTLNDEPQGRPGLATPRSPVAKFSLLFSQSSPPTIALMNPVSGSMATSAPWMAGSRLSRFSLTAASAASCVLTSSVVWMVRPPLKISSSE